jgi:hypothetical protein
MGDTEPRVAGRVRTQEVPLRERRLRPRLFRVADRLRAARAGGDGELRDARAALLAAERGVGNLFALVRAGGRAPSRAMVDEIAAAERDRDAAAVQISALEARPKAADLIPSTESIRAHVEALDRVLTNDVHRGREFLKRHVES